MVSREIVVVSADDANKIASTSTSSSNGEFSLYLPLGVYKIKVCSMIYKF